MSMLKTKISSDRFRHPDPVQRGGGDPAGVTGSFPAGVNSRESLRFARVAA